MSEGGEPKLANRHEHKKSAFVAGRTIGEKREHVETKRERVAAREKDKRKYRTRVITVSLIFLFILHFIVYSYKAVKSKACKDSDRNLNSEYLKYLKSAHPLAHHNREHFIGR